MLLDQHFIAVNGQILKKNFSQRVTLKCTYRHIRKKVLQHRSKAEAASAKNLFCPLGSVRSFVRPSVEMLSLRARYNYMRIILFNNGLQLYSALGTLLHTYAHGMGGGGQGTGGCRGLGPAEGVVKTKN